MWMKKVFVITLLSLSSIIFTACGGNDGFVDVMKNKNYIVVYKNVIAGVCETDSFKQSFEKDTGAFGVITLETDNSTNCATYGKQNNGNECYEYYVGSGDKNCVVGFDGVKTSKKVDGSTDDSLYLTAEKSGILELFF
jgi:hypothetical protein